MLIYRWQAPVLPDRSQIESLYRAEGLEPMEEVYKPEDIVEIHKHPFDEVRTVVSGELLFDVAGNKMLLRSGDKIVIPANTRHSFKAQGEDLCVSLFATKTW